MQNSSKPAYDYRAKIVVLGCNISERAAMIRGYCTNEYFQRPFPIKLGIDYMKKKMTVNEKVVDVQIWEHSNIERNPQIMRIYLRGANGVIIIYSILERDTLSYAEKILKAVEDGGFGEIPKVLVGIDVELDEYDPENQDKGLKRVVSYDEGEEFAEKNGMLYFEVSITSGKNMKQPFEGLVGRLVDEWESRKKKNLLKESFMLKNPENEENRNRQSKCSSCGP